MIKQAEL